MLQDYRYQNTQLPSNKLVEMGGLVDGKKAYGGLGKKMFGQGNLSSMWQDQMQQKGFGGQNKVQGSLSFGNNEGSFRGSEPLMNNTANIMSQGKVNGYETSIQPDTNDFSNNNGLDPQMKQFGGQLNTSIGTERQPYMNKNFGGLGMGLGGLKTNNFSQNLFNIKKQRTPTRYKAGSFMGSWGLQ